MGKNLRNIWGKTTVERPPISGTCMKLYSSVGFCQTSVSHWDELEWSRYLTARIIEFLYLFMQHFDIALTISKWREQKKTEVLLKTCGTGPKTTYLKILSSYLKWIFSGITLSKAKKAICFSDPAKGRGYNSNGEKDERTVTGYYYHYNKKGR